MARLEGHELLLLSAAHHIRGRAVPNYCQVIGGGGGVGRSNNCKGKLSSDKALHLYIINDHPVSSYKTIP